MRKLLRTLPLVFVIFAVQPTFACSITVVPPQLSVHQAAAIVEGVATAKPFTFRIGKIWKGNARSIVSMQIPETASTPCGDSHPPTVEGERYLVFLDAAPEDTPGPATGSYTRLEDSKGVINYLTNSRKLSRRNLIRMLRGWQNGTISEESFGKWLKETTPLADVDDWEEVEGYGYEVSLELDVLRALDARINQREVPLPENSCTMRTLRERVVSPLLELLGTRHLPEDFEALPVWETIDGPFCAEDDRG